LAGNKVWQGLAKRGLVRQGRAWNEVRYGMARRGMVQRGVARRAPARHGKVGMARILARSVARHGEAERGRAGLGKAGRGKAGAKVLDALHKQKRTTMDTYKITLTGETPLIMHKDNIEWSEKVKNWQKDPQNKALSVAGDDRSPAWTWIGSLYTDKRNVCMDTDNLMTMLREGGAKVPTGKKSATFKAATQSGLIVRDISPILLVNGRQIPYGPIEAMSEELDFDKHLELAHSLGFDLLLKRAKVGMAKHVRVRPLFENWKVEAHVSVIDAKKSGITKDVLKRILDEAGALCGLGDWRPSGRTPGKFGRFSVEIEQK